MRERTWGWTLEGLGSELELESALAWAEAAARGPEPGPVLVQVLVQGQVHLLRLRPPPRPGQVLQEILVQVQKPGPMRVPGQVQDPEETGELMEVVQDMVGDVVEVLEEEVAPVKGTVRATVKVMARAAETENIYFARNSM